MIAISEQTSAINPYIALVSELPSLVYAYSDLYTHAGSWSQELAGRMGVAPQKLILEIGCSNGSYLATLAQQNPSVGFLGLDWKFKLIYKAGQKLQKLGLKNISYLRGKAQELPQIFGVQELDEVWMFFPDPWPKKAQQKHRLFQEKFLLQLSQRMKPGGRFYIKTDHPGYFEWMLAVMGEALPQSSHNYSEALPTERSQRTRQFLHRTFKNEELPLASEKVRQVFELEAHSVNFWNDPLLPRLWEKTSQPLFVSQTTLFEGLFKKDNLPVYYLQLRAC